MTTGTEDTQGQDGQAGPDPKEAPQVPLKALEAERHQRQKLETQLAELRGRVEGLSSRPASSEPKTLSAAELRRAVDNGQMTEDEAEQVKERQLERRLRSEIEQDVTQKLTSQQVADRIKSEYRRYRDAIPEIEDRESQQFAKLQREFDHLVSIGYDADDPKTELAAARAAFGDPQRLKKVDPEPPETHQETGGTGEADNRTKDGAPKGLTPRLRDWYRDRIDKGIYKGWDDPALKKELSFVNQGVAKRAQDRAA